MDTAGLDSELAELGTFPVLEPHRVGICLATLAAGTFVFSLQQTMMVPVLPTVERDLHTSTAWVTWIVSGFLLVAVVSTPTFGKLGDRFGKRRFIVIGLGFFCLGSIVACVAPNIATLIAARALQGVGGGAITPLTFVLVSDIFPSHRVGAAMGVVASMSAAGISIAFILAGLAIDYFSWRVLFAVITVASAAVLVCALKFVPESPYRTASKIDVPGATLLAVGLGALLVAVTQGTAWGWTSAAILGLFGASAAIVLLWVAVELRTRHPMVDVRMLARRTVLLTNVATAAAGAIAFTFYILIPRFAETPRGLSSAVAHSVHYGFDADGKQLALYFIPGSVIGFLVGMRGGVLAHRFGPKRLLALGLGSAAGGTLFFAAFHGTRLDALLAMLSIGISSPLAAAAGAMLIIGAVRPSEKGIATALNRVMSLVGGAIGAQVGAAILTVDTIKGTTVPTESAFVLALCIFGVLAACAGAAALGAAPRRAASAPG